MSLRSPGQIVEVSLVPYSFESFFLYSGLSTRFEVAESHTVPFWGGRYAGSRFVHLSMLALEPRCFRSFAHPRGCFEEARLAFDPLPRRHRLATLPSRRGPHRLLWVGSPVGFDRLATISPRCASHRAVRSSCDEVVFRRSHLEAERLLGDRTSRRVTCADEVIWR